MERRVLYGRRAKDFKWYNYFMYEAPRHIYYGLAIGAVIWAWNIFKYVEPKLFPVVTGFVIEEVKLENGEQRIAGQMFKERNCDFVEVVAYDANNNLVDIKFLDVRNVVSRIEGMQAWGWWMVTPPVETLKLYVNHQCATGKVTTKLFEGVL